MVNKQEKQNEFRIVDFTYFICYFYSFTDNQSTNVMFWADNQVFFLSIEKKKGEKEKNRRLWFSSSLILERVS